MLRLIQQILHRIQGDTLKLLVFAGILLLAWGTLAPVGTLIWWLQEGAESLGLQNQERTKKLLPSANPSSDSAQSATINCYIVFLPGVGDFSANQLTPGEELFLDRLEQLHSNCVTVRDVFPYSVANESLGGQRFFAPLWRAADEADGWLKNADVFIKIRNLWRFAISADERYGSVYNQGIATTIVDRMNAAYPISRSQAPLKLILIGTSGGAQVSLGAVSYLKTWLNAKLIVISVGGCFDGDTGFETVDRVYHLQGRRDWVEDVARFFFASRWPITVSSPFNQARQQGRYTVVNTGPHAHDGPEGYFGTAPVKGRKTSYVELTVQKVNQLPIWSEN
jgi:hypothetical protein